MSADIAGMSSRVAVLSTMPLWSMAAGYRSRARAGSRRPCRGRGRVQGSTLPDPSVEHSMRISIALLFTIPSVATAQSADLGTVADRVFAQWTRETPGCAVGVSQGGRTLLARGYGMANLETATPITAETIFESGSVAKQFTAAATLLLMQDGKLRLGDRVQKY